MLYGENLICKTFYVVLRKPYREKPSMLYGENLIYKTFYVV
jgi:hypothetical protein